MITWKLPVYDLVTDTNNDGDAGKNKQDERNGANHSHNAPSFGENGDNYFSRAPDNNGQESSFRGKVDERTSLLPDGTRKDANQNGMIT